MARGSRIDCRKAVLLRLETRDCCRNCGRPMVRRAFYDQASARWTTRWKHARGYKRLWNRGEHPTN